jgi:hypothetical protein
MEGLAACGPSFGVPAVAERAVEFVERALRGEKSSGPASKCLTDCLGGRFTQGVKLRVSRLSAICDVRE